MKNEEPNVKPESRYSIDETCNLLGICRKTLFNYTRRNIIRCGVRKATLKKFYTGSEIKKFWYSRM